MDKEECGVRWNKLGYIDASDNTGVTVYLYHITHTWPGQINIREQYYHLSKTIESIHQDEVDGIPVQHIWNVVLSCLLDHRKSCWQCWWHEHIIAIWLAVGQLLYYVNVPLFTCLPAANYRECLWAIINNRDQHRMSHYVKWYHKL